MADSLTYSAPNFQLNGKPIAPPVVSGACNAAINHAQARMAKLASDLQDGSISLADWLAGMQTEVINMHAAQKALARGGFENMTAKDWESAASDIGPKLDALYGFAEDIAGGKYGADVSAKSFNQRVGFYSSDGRASYENEHLKVQQESGATMAKRVLGGGVASCAECLELAGDWMPIEEMVPIGDCTCRMSCHCVIVTK